MNGWPKEMPGSNDKIKRMLSDGMVSGRTSHAYAFIGGSRDSRLELGRWFAQSLFCSSFKGGPCGECLPCRKFLHGNQEDYMVISKPDDRESILKEQILSLIDRLMIKPFERYVVLIEDAQLMNAAAQNKLLKTLEEPVSDAVMILLSDRAEGLLPTVLSRCVRFYLDDDQSEASEADTAGRFVYSILTKAPYYKKRDALSDIIADKDSSRQRAEAFLDSTEELLLKVIKERRFSGRAVSDATRETLIPAAEEVRNCRKNIRQLHSVAYSLKQLCLRV